MERERERERETERQRESFFTSVVGEAEVSVFALIASLSFFL